MMTRYLLAGLATLFLGFACPLHATEDNPSPAPPPRAKPTLFLIGDSTVRNHTRGQLGWGDPIATCFDPARITVTNRALGGRSSRTYLTEGLWDKVLADLKPGDFVLMQFGHNDNGPLDDAKARASLKGNGDESRVVTNKVSAKVETVRTYGWYLRKYIADAKAKGATPIVLSLVPRKIWKDGKVVRAAKDHALWAAEAAQAEGVPFVDLNDIVARHYEELGQEKVNGLFGDEHTHTNPEGAKLNAQSVVEGLRGLKDCALTKYLALAGGPAGVAPVQEATFKYCFGPGKPAPGYIQVLPDTAFTKERGYGFEPGPTIRGVDRGGDDPLHGHFCTSDQPFLFSVALPEGNYDVTVTFGDQAGASTNTVKAESRRLMLERVVTPPGRFATRTFTVNLRTPQIPGDGAVRLKEREQGVLDWDDKLTLEFNGSRPAVCGLEIAPATNAITVFLLGDSTVTDQPREPWNSWGQMLTRFFKPGVAVANHAESGESLKSSLGAHRVQKVLSSIKPGDYLFIQYGHNDQKDQATNALATYKSNLTKLVADARARGATPVLVTSMERTAGVDKDTLGDYPATVRHVAGEAKAPLIELHEMSRALYRALGPELKQAFQDGTHHNAYGSYELAKCVVEGIRAYNLGLAKFLVEDVPPFDPSHPDPVGSFNVPPSPQSSTTKPDGS